MDTSDIASEINKSFNSSTMSIMNDRRRSSTKLLTGSSPVRTILREENRNSLGGVGGAVTGSLRSKKRKGSEQSGDGNRRPSKQDKEVGGVTKLGERIGMISLLRVSIQNR